MFTLQTLLAIQTIALLNATSVFPEDYSEIKPTNGFGVRAMDEGDGSTLTLMGITFGKGYNQTTLLHTPNSEDSSTFDLKLIIKDNPVTKIKIKYKGKGKDGALGISDALEEVASDAQESNVKRLKEAVKKAKVVEVIENVKAQIVFSVVMKQTVQDSVQFSNSSEISFDTFKILAGALIVTLDTKNGDKGEATVLNRLRAANYSTSISSSMYVTTIQFADQTMIKTILDELVVKVPEESSSTSSSSKAWYKSAWFICILVAIILAIVAGLVIFLNRSNK